jgi:adenine-specific DNA-methyltransferase
MDKLKMTSKGAVPSNVEKIAALFPNCVTERLNKDGNPEAVVDFDKLRQELSTELVEGAAERYQFTWPDKRAANHLANQPTTMTLRPCEEESVGKDGTDGAFDSENLYIEGDNLDVLKVLRETYLGKVKMIYIDPPYNTGNDFVYNDDFASSYEEFADSCKVRDEEGNITFNPKANGESEGRFHSNWLNMVYPRLKVARDLLSNDGVIFISMDDNEQRNLKNICDEIFGECNFIATIIWQKIHSIKNDAKFFSENHEYALVYAIDISSFSLGLLPRTEEMNNRYKNPDNDPRGPWQSGDLVASGERSNGHFIVTSPISGKQFDVPNGKHWVYSQSNLEELVKDNQIWFGSDGTSFPRKKRFLKDVQDGRTPSTIWLSEEVGHNQTATREVNAILNGKFFDFPKPVDYIEQMLRVANTANSIVLDFFSGSATTAHAVMKLNAEDGGHRKFIMVQLPEVTDEKSEARKAGYNTICEIGKERIRRAGRKIKEEAGLQGQDLDIGFRVLKLAESNMEDVFYTPDKFEVRDLFTLADNVKQDRTAEDLLFQVMLELGVELSSPIEKKSINGVEVFNVKDGFLIATFDKDVNESTITEIAKSEPVYFVMRDASAANDNVLDNFDQLFRHYSPDTIRRIL